MKIFDFITSSSTQAPQGSIKIGHLNFWFIKEPSKEAKDEFARFVQQKAQFLDRKDLKHNANSLSPLFGKDTNESMKFMFVVVAMLDGHFKIVEEYGMSILVYDSISPNHIREAVSSLTSLDYLPKRPLVFESKVTVDIGSENRPPARNNDTNDVNTNEDITVEIEDTAVVENNDKKTEAEKPSKKKAVKKSTKK